MSADELEKRIRQREAEAKDLAPTSQQRQAIMDEILRLRLYAEAKRWIDSPGFDRRT